MKKMLAALLAALMMLALAACGGGNGGKTVDVQKLADDLKDNVPFSAAMIAAAAVCDDIPEIIQTGLA